MRGHRHQVRYVTDVAFSRVSSPERSGSSTAPLDTENDRAELERLLGDVFRRTGAYWRRPERMVDYAWIRRPDLVLSAPVLRASKPRGLRPNLIVPPSIVVAGIPYSGAPDVGALLATSLDWEYTDLRNSAQERFGTAPGSPDEMAAQTEIARLLLEEMSIAAGRRVWAFDDIEPLVETLPSIGPELPLVIFLRVPDAVVAYAAEQSPRGSTARQMEMAQNQARGIVDGLIEKRKERAVVLDLPQLPIQPGTLHDVDLFFDAYVELAFQAVRWLKEFHGGPPLEETQGILGGLWRSTHGRNDATGQL
jgi:hypothetical protein